MNTPGFTAEASLYKTSGRYGAVETQEYRNGEQKIISQLSVDRFGGEQGVGILDGFGSWLCGLWCKIVHSFCLEGCEGTPENPKGSTHCIICDDQYRACSQECRRSSRQVA
jgi:hypothetical protein